MANTPNFSLYKPNRADNNVEVDTSLADNFTKIDTELQNNKGGLAAHISNPNAHTSENVSHADGSVKTMLDNHESRLTQNTTTINTLVLPSVSANSETISNHETRLETVETSTEDLDSRVTDIETLGIDKLAPNLDGRISTLESDIEGVLAPATFDAMDQQSYTFDEYRIGYVDSKLADIATVNIKSYKNLVVAKGTANEDWTNAIQQAVNDLTDYGTLYIPSGIYRTKRIYINAKNNINIMGNGCLQAFTDGTPYNAVLDIFQCNNIKIDGVRFIGLGGQTNQPTNYTSDEYSLIRIYSCTYPKITNCSFSNFVRHAIYSFFSTGSFRVRGLNITNCTFENQVSVNSNKESAIYIDSSSEYGFLRDCNFYDVKSAIHCYGANWHIVDNNITNGSLTVQSSPTTVDHYISFEQAWILVAQQGAENASKVQIKGNKLNHLSGDSPCILVKGPGTTRNESFNLILNNEMLVNSSKYFILIYNTINSRVEGNHMGQNPISGSTSALITLKDNDELLLDKNHFFGDVISVYNINSTFYDGKHTFRFLGTSRENYVYDGTNAGKRIPLQKEYSVTFFGNGAIATGYTDAINWLVTRNGTGDFTITHNLNSMYYTPIIFFDNGNTSNARNATIKKNDNNSVTVQCYDSTGALVDATGWFTLKLFHTTPLNIKRVV